MAGNARIANELGWLGCRNSSQETHILGEGLATHYEPGLSKYRQRLLTRPREWLKDMYSTPTCMSTRLGFFSIISWTPQNQPICKRQKRGFQPLVWQEGGKLNVPLPANERKTTFPSNSVIQNIYQIKPPFPPRAIVQELDPSRRFWSSLSLSLCIPPSMPFPHFSDSWGRQDRHQDWRTSIPKSSLAPAPTDVSGPRSAAQVLSFPSPSSAIKSTSDWGPVSASYQSCVTLDDLYNLSEPQFSPLQNGITRAFNFKSYCKSNSCNIKWATGSQAYCKFSINENYYHF